MELNTLQLQCQGTGFNRPQHHRVTLSVGQLIGCHTLEGENFPGEWIRILVNSGSTLPAPRPRPSLSVAFWAAPAARIPHDFHAICMSFNPRAFDQQFGAVLECVVVWQNSSKQKYLVWNYFVKPRRIPRQLQIADQILCRILKGGATSENPEMLNTLCFFPNIPCISLDPKNSSGLEGQGMHISIKHSCLAPSTRLASDTSTCGIFVWDSNRLGKKKGVRCF